MKVAEILFLCHDFMQTLHQSGVKMCDYRYVSMYRDYLKMRVRGEKMTAIVMELSERYRCSERFVYKLLKKLEKDCTIGAVE